MALVPSVFPMPAPYLDRGRDRDVNSAGSAVVAVKRTFANVHERESRLLMEEPARLGP